MKELNIVIISIIMNIKSITFISAGMILTGLGIAFTFIGTLKQGKEKDAFQAELTESGKKSIELAEKLADQTKNSSEELIKQTRKSSKELAEQSEKSTQKIVQLSDKNVELTQKLTEISEEKFRRLSIPSMNVLGIEENLSLGANSYFKIIAKNTGNSDCFDARLLVDRHNSPLASPGLLTIQSFKKVPKDAIFEYKIPIFQSDFMVLKDKEQEFETFMKKFNDNEAAIIIFFHFEYEWNDETLKSSQYSIIKSTNKKPYVSSSEEHVEPEVKLPKWKK